MPNSRTYCFLALASAVSCSSLHAGHEMQKHQTYKIWHDACLRGNLGTIERQIARYEARLAADPNDSLARAYLGSACALKAKHASWPLTKLKFLKRGQKELDAAAERAPHNPRVRMVRAIAYYKVPKRFGCRPTSLRDFDFLLAHIQQKSSPLAVNEKQAALYYAWKAYTEEGEKRKATQARNHCHKLAPSSKYGKLTAPR